VRKKRTSPVQEITTEVDHVAAEFGSSIFARGRLIL
jgi:hypothetical protein